MTIEPMTREDVIKAVERKRPSRIPLVRAKWWGEGLDEQYGDRLTFLAGIDVQHTLQEEDPDGVREEVRFLVDTFDRPDGGMCIAAGNGIVAGTPFENIEAFLDEAVVYGREHRSR